jgi:prepilin-type N-terminal cleavage/methylation domain-containing protein
MKITAQQIIKKEQGFTLIELLVVIGILAVLMGIVLVAINPSRQFNQANDASRANSARQILNAIGAFAADHKGTLPTAITNVAPHTWPIVATEIKNGAGNLDLCTDLVPTYISALPEDPSIANGAAITNCASYDAGFQAAVDASGRVTISAPNAAYGPIQVTR